MPNTADILYELERAQADMSSKYVAFIEAHTKRNELLRQALAAGVKQADLARLTGVSRARIAQLR